MLALQHIIIDCLRMDGAHVLHSLPELRQITTDPPQRPWCKGLAVNAAFKVVQEVRPPRSGLSRIYKQPSDLVSPFSLLTYAEANIPKPERAPEYNTVGKG